MKILLICFTTFCITAPFFVLAVSKLENFLDETEYDDNSVFGGSL